MSTLYVLTIELERLNKQLFKLEGITEEKAQPLKRRQLRNKASTLNQQKENLLLELHYNIENYLGLSQAELDPFFQQTEEIVLGGGKFRCMNRHRDFLYLTFHGAVHQYRRLFWLRDIAKVLKQLNEISMGMILGPEFPSFGAKARHHLFMLRLKPELGHYLRTLREIINRQYIGKFLGGH